MLLAIARWRMIRQTAFSAYNTPRLDLSCHRTGLCVPYDCCFAASLPASLSSTPRTSLPSVCFSPFSSSVLSVDISLTLDVVIYEYSHHYKSNIVSPCYAQRKRSNIPDEKHILHIPIAFETTSSKHRHLKQTNNTIEPKEVEIFIVAYNCSYLKFKFLINCTFLTYL